MCDSFGRVSMMTLSLTEAMDAALNNAFANGFKPATTCGHTSAGLFAAVGESAGVVGATVCVDSFDVVGALDSSTEAVCGAGRGDDVVADPAATRPPTFARPVFGSTGAGGRVTVGRLRSSRTSVSSC